MPVRHYPTSHAFRDGRRLGGGRFPPAEAVFPRLTPVHCYPTFARPLPDLYPTLTRPLPDLYPTLTRPLPNLLPDLYPTFTRLLPELYRIFTRPLPDLYLTYPTLTRQLAYFVLTDKETTDHADIGRNEHEPP